MSTPEEQPMEEQLTHDVAERIDVAELGPSEKRGKTPPRSPSPPLMGARATSGEALYGERNSATNSLSKEATLREDTHWLIMEERDDSSY